MAAPRPDALDGQLTVGSHTVPLDEVEGLLFDCDGTLIDSMPLFLHSWVEVCPAFGLEMTEEAFYGFAGMPLDAIVRHLHRTQLGGEASDEFVAEFLAAKKKAHDGTEAKLGTPKPINCVIQLARDAERRGIPIAVATSGLREHVEGHLKAAGLSDLFNRKKKNVVYAADVKAGKPAPDIFIEAARRLGVAPSKCRAYEDGETGLRSAHAAGCHVMDVTYMHDYPSCAGLRRAKELAAERRTWLPSRALSIIRRLRMLSVALLCACVAFGTYQYDSRMTLLLLPPYFYQYGGTLGLGALNPLRAIRRMKAE